MYLESPDLSKEEREAMESHITFYGKVPSQLFIKPHPKRNPPPKERERLHFQISRDLFEMFPKGEEEEGKSASSK